MSRRFVAVMHGLAVLTTLLCLGSVSAGVELLAAEGSVHVVADGGEATDVLGINESGQLEIELGTPGAGNEYAAASLTSQLTSTRFILGMSVDTDPTWRDEGRASASVDVDFVLTRPTVITIHRGASGAAYSNGVRLSNQDGTLFTDLGVHGVLCFDEHPLVVGPEFEVCFAATFTYPAGTYRLELFSYSYFPDDCGSCHGFEGYGAASADVTFEAAAPSVTVGFDSLGLTWNDTVDASTWDVVEGDLATLRQSGGDFAAATTLCVANDTPTNALPVTAPSPGTGRFYLVRKTGENWAGTYDATAGAQQGSRNHEVDDSPFACP